MLGIASARTTVAITRTTKRAIALSAVVLRSGRVWSTDSDHRLHTCDCHGLIWGDTDVSTTDGEWWMCPITEWEVPARLIEEENRTSKMINEMCKYF